MRPGRLRLRVMAAWLGVLALALDALVPVHLAFDLAHAAAPTRHRERPADRDFIAVLLTLVTGHHDAAGAGGAPERHHRGDHCAVCGAAATLAHFAPAAAVLLWPPAFAGVPKPAPPAAETPRPLAFVAYRSRAPPLA